VLLVTHAKIERATPLDHEALVEKRVAPVVFEAVSERQTEIADDPRAVRDQP
jgi:hypothetical protein